MNTFCADSATVWQFLGEIIYIIRIVIPVIIILLGTLDLGKAVMAGEDKKIKEAQKTFLKRIIYGVAIFFMFTIVEVIFGLLGVETTKGDSKICWDCATKPHNKACLKYVDEINEKDNQTSDKDEPTNEDSDDENHGKEEV